MAGRQAGLAWAGGVALVCVGGSAAAQDADRIAAIERQLRTLQSELSRLRRDQAGHDAALREARAEAARARAVAAAPRLDTRPPAAEAPAPASPPQGDPVRLTLEQGRPTIASADGRFRAFLGGQAQWDVGGALQGAPGVAGSPAQRLDTFGQNLRRARLFFGVRYDDLQLNVTPEFGGSPDGTPSLYEANLNWTPVPRLTLTVGYFKPWVTLQDSMSSNDFLLLERPSIVEIARGISAGDSRSSLGGRWAAERWFAAAYLTGDSYGSNATQATTGQTGGVARVAGRPVATPEFDLHVGVSATYAFDLKRTASGQTLQLRDRPEWRIDQTRLIDTGSLAADHAYAWGPEFGLRWRNLMLQGEYIRISVDQARLAGQARPDLSFSGGYVEASWVLTGETRRYSTSAAAFARPNPAHPFDLRGGGRGAWEVAARYSVADLDDRVTRGRPQAATGGVFGGRQEVIGLGLSWYPTNLLRLLLGWNIVNVDRLNAAGTTQIGQRFHTIGLRTQLAF